MKNDLSNCKAGDKIWTIHNGWVEITRVLPTVYYPINVGMESYTFEGKHSQHDDYPCAFLEPPEGFDLKPEFTKGQKVLVSNTLNDKFPLRRYFSHMKDGKYHCFASGTDEWTSDGDTVACKYCKAWEE